MEMLPTTTHEPTTHPNVYFYPAPKHTPHWLIRRRHWHPKITVYRLLVTALTISLGTAKAITSTSTGGSSCSVTIEWISGIIILLLTFFLSRYETHDDPKPRWVFKYDLLDAIRALWLRQSSYGNEDRYPEPTFAIRGPLVTGYRLLVSMSALVFGVVKATLSYLGYKTAPTVVEWVFGVVITVSLYWLGMYENSPTVDMPWLFVKDCSNQVFVYFLCAVHLAALFASHYWTVSRFNRAKQEFHKHWETQNTTYLSSLDRFIHKASVVSPIGAGIGTGVVGTCAILAFLGWILTPGLVQLYHACVQGMRRFSRQRWFPKIPMPSWMSLPSWLTASLEWLSLSPSIWIKLFGAASVTAGATVYLHLYGIGRIGFIVASAWVLPWLCVLLAMPWPQNTADIPSAVAFHLGFTLFWTKIVWVVILVCLAIPLVVMVTCMVTVCPSRGRSHRLMSYRDSELLRQRRQRLEETERLLSESS